MLKGERVTLRPVRLDDLPTLYDALIDPDTWHATNDTALWPMPFAEYEQLHAKRAAEEAAEFSVEVDGELIGRCALWQLDDLARNANLGINFGRAHQGKGYGKDTIRVLLDYAFNKRNLHRVQLEVLATNVSAMAAYAACGFVDEGRLREHAYVTGAWVDLVVMGVLRKEWLAAYGGR
ncbi:MAG: GNAT family protein [Mycobacteriales bacterium]